MRSSTLTIPASIYRPKHLPRVIRRQWRVIRLIALLSLLGLVAVSVAWRNVLNERLQLDVARQRAELERLTQETAHLSGLVESAASYPRISEWAAAQRGWKPIEGRVQVIEISAERLVAEARIEAQIAGGFDAP